MTYLFLRIRLANPLKRIKFETDWESTVFAIRYISDDRRGNLLIYLLIYPSESASRAHGAPSDATEAVSRSSPRSYRLLSHATRFHG